VARFLVYTSPARGHLFPITGVLVELAARGHEIAVRTLASQVGQMESLGFTAAPIAAAIEEIENDDWKARTPLGANRRLFQRQAERAEHEISDMRKAIADVRPEVLVVDISCLGAAALAEAERLPWAHWTPYLSPLPSADVAPYGLGMHPRHDTFGRLRDALLAPIVLGPPERVAGRATGGLRQRFGLAPLARGTDLWRSAPLNLNFTAEPFEYPRSDWPASYRFLGPGSWQPAVEPPAWLDALERPLVLVTLSTEFQDDGKLAEVALEALRDEDVDVIVTTAAIDPARFSPPPNARVERFVSHDALLQRAACVVCHGGMGITQRALAAGVPVCVVPFGRDQLEVAGHVTWCGAGTRVFPALLTPDRLRSAVHKAKKMQSQARRVAEGFKAAGGSAAGADALEELVANLPVAAREARELG
jgi:UDP:flavonoid glycosyltransferase YjiC (YdhE family)